MKNFMSFQDASRTFGGTGLTLIEGDNRDDGDSNGSGKSSVWDAISWCLFGTTVRGVESDVIVNRAFGKDCAVIVALQTGKSTFVVRRYRKHSGKDKQGQAFGNRLIVEVNGETVEKSSIADTQRWLIDELGIDFNLFRCTILFAQEERFNFVSETDKKQKEILSKVRRVDFGKGLVNARQALKEHAEKEAEIDRKLAILTSHVSESVFKSLQDESAYWEAERAVRLAECRDKIRALKATIRALPDQLPSSQFATVRFKINAVITNRQTSRRTALARLNDIKQRQGYTTGRWQDLKKLKDQCPTCEQPIEAARLDAKLEELRLQRIALVREAASAERAVESEDTEIAELTKKLAAVTAKESEQEMLEAKRKWHGDRLEELNTERLRIDEEENPVKAKLAEAKKKQERIISKIEELNVSKVELAERLPYLQFWEQGYGDRGIKSFLFDTVCGTLTAKANYYLGILSGGAVSVSFDTQTALKSGETRERFECSVMVDGQAVPYATYSGGEKTRISLAVDMALCDLMCDSYGSSFNIVVFDEQTTWLDAHGRDSFMRLLKERAKTQLVFVIDHDAEFKTRFDSVWTVIKEKGVSRFVA